MSKMVMKLWTVFLGLAVTFPVVAAAQPATRIFEETAASYREQARYPRHSWALEQGQADPVRAERLPSRLSARGPQGEEPVLTVWAGQVSYEAGEPVALYATLTAAGAAQAADLRAEIVSEGGEIVATALYRDDGEGADQHRGDGIYSAQVSGLPEPALAAPYLVRVEAQLADGSLRHAAGGFLLSHPWAHLTGRFRDSLRDGSVVVSAQVEVEQAGRFHLVGTLHTPQGDPVGVAQTAVELEAGRHWLDLEFYGLMFHDRGVAGPYVLGAVTLTTAAGMPNALTQPLERAYVTRPYRLDQLRRAPFGEPGLTRAAERLEAEAALARIRAQE